LVEDGRMVLGWLDWFLGGCNFGEWVSVIFLWVFCFRELWFGDVWFMAEWYCFLGSWFLVVWCGEREELCFDSSFWMIGLFQLRLLMELQWLLFLSLMFGFGLLLWVIPNGFPRVRFSICFWVVILIMLVCS
jgi:hypothetical protein